MYILHGVKIQNVKVLNHNQWNTRSCCLTSKALDRPTVTYRRSTEKRHRPGSQRSSWILQASWWKREKLSPQTPKRKQGFKFFRSSLKGFKKVFLFLTRVFAVHWLIRPEAPGGSVGRCCGSPALLTLPATGWKRSSVAQNTGRSGERERLGRIKIWSEVFCKTPCCPVLVCSPSLGELIVLCQISSR